jgi:hypothetical protein
MLACPRDLADHAPAAASQTDLPPQPPSTTLHYMSSPLSIRFDPALLARLRRRAEAAAGGSVSTLAQTLIDEGLRMAEHPGIVFKSGPSGRRAALSNGPDVWEMVKFLIEAEIALADAASAAAEAAWIAEQRLLA